MYIVQNPKDIKESAVESLPPFTVATQGPSSQVTRMISMFGYISQRYFHTAV